MKGRPGVIETMMHGFLKDVYCNSPKVPSDTSALWKASDLRQKSSVQYQLLFKYEGDETWEREIAGADSN